MHTLLFLAPGHFHAALTLRVRNPRVNRAIHVYARPGAERGAFTGLVRSFNTRADDPTDRDLRVHESNAPERALVEERCGNVVVLAGRNQPKLGTIARLHAAGLHVLTDKPWLTDPCGLPDLARVTEGWPLTMDIMTFRHDAIARITHRLAASPDLFGALSVSSREPAIDLHSVHHLLKVVNGAPLIRPPWHYDTRIQGNGLVDIQSQRLPRPARRERMAGGARRANSDPLHAARERVRTRRSSHCATCSTAVPKAHTVACTSMSRSGRSDEVTSVEPCAPCSPSLS